MLEMPTAIQTFKRILLYRKIFLILLANNSPPISFAPVNGFIAAAVDLRFVPRKYLPAHRELVSHSFSFSLSVSIAMPSIAHSDTALGPGHSPTVGE